VRGSSTSNTELGHGVMQGPAPSGLHAGSTGTLVSPLQAETATSVASKSSLIAMDATRRDAARQMSVS